MGQTVWIRILPDFFFVGPDTDVNVYKWSRQKTKSSLAEKEFRKVGDTVNVRCRTLNFSLNYLIAK